MAKNNMELVCSIGELSSLFEKRTNIQGFLQDVVQLVAKHMQTDACSIFLREETTDELVLSATVGLNINAVGKVRLAPGEGITGQALKQMTPINVPNGWENPYFKFVPGIMEERYKAVLSVPIVHGVNRIGAILLQHSSAGYFDETDTRALKTIASQLAALIENAKLLMEIHKTKKARHLPHVEIVRPYFMQCTTDSPGIALGRAVLLNEGSDFMTVAEEEEGKYSISDFLAAVERTEIQLEELQRGMEERLSDLGSLIFSSHLLMLRDESFSGKMVKLIEHGQSPSRAVQKVVTDYMQLFAESENMSVREKVQDLKDLGHRLLLNLSSDAERGGDYSGQIIVAEEILPSQLAKLAAQHAQGFIVFGSGVTTHLAILSRSLEIPLVRTTDSGFHEIQTGEKLVIDGYQNTVIFSPQPNVQKKYEDMKTAHGARKKPMRKAPKETKTRDGKKITLQANVNLLCDLGIARENNAEGIGLYRSEFPFIIRNAFPSEEEQFLVYSQVAAGLGNREIVFRTLDIGGDKIFTHLSEETELNPFLGLRAIRFSLRNTSIFKEQLRAMLRAGHKKQLSIMFPLISSLDEFKTARAILDECVNELDADRIPHNREPKVGVMIEIPSAVIQAEALASAADFLSIGTNDLVQYLLGVDRTNSQVSHMYNPMHPAVLRSLRYITEGAKVHGRPVSICGEAAASKRMLVFLIGLGVELISVDPRLIPYVRQEISEIDSSEAARISNRMLKMSRTQEIEDYLGTIGI